MAERKLRAHEEQPLDIGERIIQLEEQYIVGVHEVLKLFVGAGDAPCNPRDTATRSEAAQRIAQLMANARQREHQLRLVQEELQALVTQIRAESGPPRDPIEDFLRKAHDEGHISYELFQEADSKPDGIAGQVVPIVDTVNTELATPRKTAAGGPTPSNGT